MKSGSSANNSCFPPRFHEKAPRKCPDFSTLSCVVAITLLRAEVLYLTGYTLDTLYHYATATQSKSALLPLSRSDSRSTEIVAKRVQAQWPAQHTIM